MGIYSRDYYRETRSTGGWGWDGLTPVVKFIIFANVAVFLLQIFVVREVRVSPLEMMRKYNPEFDKFLKEKEADPEALEALKKKHPEWNRYFDEELEPLFGMTERVSILQEWFELDTNKIIYSGQIWRVLTHAFCHDRFSIWHLIVNMLLLYWFGGTLETMYGSREFTLFYLAAAVVAALAFMGMDLYTGSRIPAIGASGAVMAVMMLYTMHFPYETIFFCWFFPLQMRWVMLFYVIFDLHPVLLALSGDRMFTGIAHAAHLGGLAFGFLYHRFEWRLDDLVDKISWPRWRWKRRPKLRLVSAPPPEREPEPDADASRVDEILAKIFDSGEASLTDEERAILREASERIKNRSRRDG